MTPFEQAILRNYGTWQVADILCNPDAGISHAKQSRHGGSHLEVHGTAWWFDTTAKGIELRDGPGADAKHLLRWTTIRRYADTVPTELRERLAAHRRVIRKHMASYHRFMPSKAATEERMSKAAESPIFDAEQAEWEEYVTGYYAEQRELYKAEAALLDEALPDCTQDAQDLFDILQIAEAMEAS